MSAKKNIPQKKATQPAIKSIPSRTKEKTDERYNPPKPIPTFKDRPKPKLTPVSPSQPSKPVPVPASQPSKKD